MQCRGTQACLMIGCEGRGAGAVLLGAEARRRRARVLSGLERMKGERPAERQRDRERETGSFIENSPRRLQGTQQTRGRRGPVKEGVVLPLLQHADFHPLQGLPLKGFPIEATMELLASLQPACACTCLVRSPDCAKALPHSRRRNRRSSVCIGTWPDSFLSDAHALPHVTSSCSCRSCAATCAFWLFLNFPCLPDGVLLSCQTKKAPP